MRSEAALQLGSIVGVNVQERSTEVWMRPFGTPFSRDLCRGVKSYIDAMLQTLVQHRILEFGSTPGAGEAPLHSQHLHSLEPQSVEPRLLHGWLR